MCVNCNEMEEKCILGTCNVFNCVYVNVKYTCIRSVCLFLYLEILNTCNKCVIDKSISKFGHDSLF